MNIAKVHVERLNKTGESRLTLRNGQVAFGKVNKIYPNNRAEVQIGSHRFIAQIETPLAVGERYIFEVNKKSDQLIHLKVISTQINEMKQDHIVSLLRQLHINVNQINVSFAQSLLNEKIPFRKNELINALQLLDKFGHSINNQTIMKQMMMNKYPIQESIFQSLLAVKQNNFSESIARVLNVSSSITPSQTL